MPTSPPRDIAELLARPEVRAVIVATDEQEHVEPILQSVELGVPLFIEKPLATDPVDSARVLAAIEDAGIDAVVGYTQRFRRRFLRSSNACATGRSARSPRSSPGPS